MPGAMASTTIQTMNQRNDNVVTPCYAGPTFKTRIGAHDMTAATTDKPRRDTLNLRIPATERNRIDRAAASTGKTRIDFILEAARRAAEEALLDRALTVVSAEAYAKFLERLDQPAQPNERLRKTMRAKAPWTRA